MPPDDFFCPERGGLLFQCWTDSAFGAAICSVTAGVAGAAVSHAAICDGRGRVIEALPGAGVVETPLPAFLGRSRDAADRPAVWAARLNARWRPWADAAVDRAAARIGAPYNAAFAPDGPGLYCSQLVYEAYLGPKGRPLFDLAPMTFRRADGETAPGWAAYFHDLGVPPPEGALGTNPGLLSRSAKLEIVHRYGDLTLG